jgi:hypothetical protein
MYHKVVFFKSVAKTGDLYSIRELICEGTIFSWSNLKIQHNLILSPSPSQSRLLCSLLLHLLPPLVVPYSLIVRQWQGVKDSESEARGAYVGSIMTVRCQRWPAGMLRSYLACTGLVRHGLLHECTIAPIKLNIWDFVVFNTINKSLFTNALNKFYLNKINWYY